MGVLKSRYSALRGKSLDKIGFQYVEQEHDKEVRFLLRHPMSQSPVN